MSMSLQKMQGCKNQHEWAQNQCQDYNTTKTIAVIISCAGTYQMPGHRPQQQGADKGEYVAPLLLGFHEGVVSTHTLELGGSMQN